MPEDKESHIIQTIKSYGKNLLGFIRRRVKSDADAEDILQDVWYQFTTTVDTEPIEQVSNWLFTVARNKITDRYRKKKPESLENLLNPDNGEDDGPNFSAILFDNSNNPETVYLKSLFWKTLQEALLELPQEQSSIFIWNELAEIPFKEIAAATGENINTLISRKRYAVLFLRERLLTLYNEILNY